MASVLTYISQAGVIPIRAGKICLITSSNGRRWVIPKGSIEPGETASENALKEAWEEAGIVGALDPEPVGSYLYDKYGGTCHVTVYVLRVTQAADDWPERELRQREWLRLGEVLERIEDPGLCDLIRKVARAR
jgi:8-oxo-dGTP pyrophosphatase MutT (NUDIX family)